MEERRPEHETLRMALLPPGVREVQKERRHAPRRAEMPERLARVRVEHARPPAEALLPEPLVHDRRPFQPDLQPDEAYVGPRRAPLEEEPAAPWADLDLDRAASG